MVNPLQLFLLKFEFIIDRSEDKKTGNMAAPTSRSEQVVEHFKKHKLAISAIRRIQALILGFEKDRQADALIARVGLVAVILAVAFVIFYFLGMDSVTIS